MNLENTIVGYCGAIGGLTGLVVDGGSGFLTGGAATGLGAMIGSGIGKGFCAAVTWCMPLSKIPEDYDDTKEKVKQAVSNLEKITALFAKAMDKLGGGISLILGAGGSVVGGISFKVVECLDIESSMENGQQIEQGFKVASLMIVALGLSAVAFSVLRGMR